MVTTASEPVQLDKAVTATQSMMLRKRKATQDKAEIMEQERKAVTSNDMDEETELKEDLEESENSGDLFNDAEEKDSNYDPSDEKCNDLDELLDETVEDADPQVNVETELDSMRRDLILLIGHIKQHWNKDIDDHLFLFVGKDTLA